jgi:hypothetical protein
VSSDATVVFTGEGVDSILRDGGTSSWRLSREQAAQRPYVLCTRNAKADWAEGSEDHRKAFLVGRVRDVVPCEPRAENNESPKNRHRIQFSEYAVVDIPEAWPKGSQNPVRYMSLSDFGIDPKSLAWKKMPGSS